jgi:ATP-dependent Clp protease ATP-binding subunit ClpC
MFERFEESSRQVIVLAQDEARALQHNYIGTEHLLLGLLRERDGIAAQVLESLGLTVDDARAAVGRIVGRGADLTGKQIPFTPRAKKVLEGALREAIALHNLFIGTQHLLLGLLREDGSVAVRILLEHDLEPDAVRERVHAAIACDDTEEVHPQTRARPAPPAPSRRWEYRVETWPPAGGGDRMEVLGRLGAEGWELVAGVGAAELIFKRPAQPTRPADPGEN